MAFHNSCLQFLLYTLHADKACKGNVCALQGMIELQKVQASQQKEAAAAAYRAAHEDSDEDSDAKVDKQRAWDDWKDENPSGWGNSKLRPTA